MEYRKYNVVISCGGEFYFEKSRTTLAPADWKRGVAGKVELIELRKTIRITPTSVEITPIHYDRTAVVLLTRKKRRFVIHYWTADVGLGSTMMPRQDFPDIWGTNESYWNTDAALGPTTQETSQT